jgi:hypothetical protein
MKDDEIAQLPACEQPRLHEANRVLKHLEVAAEWGIKSWKDCWRIHHTLIAAESDTDVVWCAVFEVTLRLVNVRVMMMGVG